MLSKVERFWIAFSLRFAFGFLFLFAGLNIFMFQGAGGAAKDSGPEGFATLLTKPFESSWLWRIQGEETFVEFFVHWFLYLTPFVMVTLSVPILTGIFAKPALRLGA